MKKTISFIATVILSVTLVSAQPMKGNRGGFGIRGGVNFQNINGKNSNGDKLKNDMYTGFNVGVNIEIPLGTSFFLQPALLFTTKGAKGTGVIFPLEYSNTIRISYVELPINFLFKPMVGRGHFLLGFGPYIAVGVDGEAEYTSGSISRTVKVKFTDNVKITDPNDVTYIKTIDAGANLLLGYEFSNKISFQLNAQLGLMDINPTYDGRVNDKTTARNTGFGLSIGYRF